MQKFSKLIWVYLIFDYVAAMAAWFMLFVYRKIFIEEEAYEIRYLLEDPNFTIGLLLLPAAWVLLHFVSGTYTDVYRKSRIGEVGKTFLISLIGCTIIFFALLLDDLVKRYSDYYFTFLTLFISQFIFTSVGRVMILTYAKRNLESGRKGFKTIIIGSNKEAGEVFEELTGKPFSFGYHFVGYVEVNGKSFNPLTEKLPSLGRLEQLEEIVDKHEVEEVIIAIETSEHDRISYLLNTLAGKNIHIKIIPDLFDILSGTVKINHIISAAFIEIPPTVLSEWEIITKRWFDVALSMLAIAALFVPMLFIGLIIKLTSKGAIFYTQERIGQFGKPFRIIKFRSMYVDAEKEGPKLTSDKDNRITPIGHFIRKYRIDELPQFVNVIKGEMSIVGPRAERAFFAQQILQHAPYYKHVWKVKPGITSLGMVKYGYASSVEEMLKRLKFDILYIENMSLALDFKVMIYTVLTVLKGRGK